MQGLQSVIKRKILKGKPFPLSPPGVHPYTLQAWFSSASFPRLASALTAAEPVWLHGSVFLSLLSVLPTAKDFLTFTPALLLPSVINNTAKKIRFVVDLCCFCMC